MVGIWQDAQNTSVKGDSNYQAEMSRHRGWRPLLSVLLVCSLPAPALFADTATRFVEMLRAEGHSDLVPDYLERAAEDPLVSDAFRERIPYERLAAAFSQAEQIAGSSARVAALRELQPDLEKLAQSDANARQLLVDLSAKLATTAADLARNEALSAKRYPIERERQDRLVKARQSIKSSRKDLDQAESRIEAERETLKSVRADSPAGERRAKLGSQLGLVRLLRTRLLHELAETYPTRSKDRESLNREAASQFEALYQQYSKWNFGLFAHLYEARCYRLLGETALARAAIEGLTSQPDSVAEVRPIMTLAHAERAALYLEQGKAKQALGTPREWFEKLDASEKTGSEAALLQYHLAQAAIALAQPAIGAEKKRLLRDARDWLARASRVASEVQADAREQWAEVSTELGVESPTYETFDQALAAAGESIQTMLAFDEAINGAEAKQRSRLQAQRNEARSVAYAALQMAVRLSDRKVDLEKAAQVRYQVAWLDWDRGDTKKAAARAEHVARNQPATEAGQQAARLALAAYEQLQREQTPQAGERIEKLAKFVLTTWPESELSEAASSVLLGVALRSGDLDAAESVLKEIPEASRDSFRLRLAVAKWERAKKQKTTSMGLELAELQRSHDALSGEARRSPISVTATLYLAEAALEAGEVIRAKRLLNDPQSGVAEPLAEGVAPANSPVFTLAALRAMIRAESLTGGKPKGFVRQFADVLGDAPIEQTGGDRAWLALGVGLLSDLNRSNESSAQRLVAETLSQVLSKLSPLESSCDWNTLLWIAQARLKISGLLSSEAQQDTLSAARGSFSLLVKRGIDQQSFAPSSRAVLAARLRLAECDRQLGEYAKALESLEAVLTETPALLDAQRLAAQTLQDLGVQAKQVEDLEKAIAGTRPGADGKNLLWGWSKLAAVAGRFAGSDPGRRQLYFDAWRGVAESRYQAALISSGEKRENHLRKAANTLAAVLRKNPDLGGPENKKRYNELSQAIREAQGGTSRG